MLELASGKNPLEKLDSMMTLNADPRPNWKYVEDELKRVVLVRLICADSRPKKRLTMLRVIELLMGDEEKQSLYTTREMFKNTSVAADFWDWG